MTGGAINPVAIFAALPESLRRAFDSYQKNGRWGTCVDCTYSDPAKCQYADRYDHKLTVQDLDRAIGWHVRAMLEGRR